MLNARNANKTFPFISENKTCTFQLVILKSTNSFLRTLFVHNQNRVYEYICDGNNFHFSRPKQTPIIF